MTQRGVPGTSKWYFVSLAFLAPVHLMQKPRVQCTAMTAAKTPDSYTTQHEHR